MVTARRNGFKIRPGEAKKAPPAKSTTKSTKKLAKQSRKQAPTPVPDKENDVISPVKKPDGYTGRRGLGEWPLTSAASSATNTPSPQKMVATSTTKGDAGVSLQAQSFGGMNFHGFVPAPFNGVQHQMYPSQFYGGINGGVGVRPNLAMHGNGLGQQSNHYQMMQQYPMMPQMHPMQPMQMHGYPYGAGMPYGLPNMGYGVQNPGFFCGNPNYGLQQPLAGPPNMPQFTSNSQNSSLMHGLASLNAQCAQHLGKDGGRKIKASQWSNNYVQEQSRMINLVSLLFFVTTN